MVVDRLGLAHPEGDQVLPPPPPPPGDSRPPLASLSVGGGGGGGGANGVAVAVAVCGRNVKVGGPHHLLEVGRRGRHAFVCRLPVRLFGQNVCAKREVRKTSDCKKKIAWLFLPKYFRKSKRAFQKQVFRMQATVQCNRGIISGFVLIRYADSVRTIVSKVYHRLRCALLCGIW